MKRNHHRFFVVVVVILSEWGEIVSFFLGYYLCGYSIRLCQALVFMCSLDFTICNMAEHEMKHENFSFHLA